MSWKEQLGELKSLAKQEDKTKTGPGKPRVSRKKVAFRVQKIIAAFTRSTGWQYSVDGWDYKIPSTFQVHPKAEGDEPWNCLGSQIVIRIDSGRDQLEIIPPPVLTKGDPSRNLSLALSSFSEEELAQRLRDFYLQLYAAGSGKASPACIEEDDDFEIAFKLGWYYSENKDEFQMAKVAEKDRSTHLYVIGATGSGKTKFLEFLIQQDIEKGSGFGVIDPHGDLIEDIKGILACHHCYQDEEILERVVLIDPTDPNYTVTFNPLEELPNVSVAEQAGELVSSFRKIWSDSWGVRMEDLMRNSLIALGEAKLSLSDLPRFLTNRTSRESVLAKVEHPLVHDYFRRFDAMTDRGQLPFIEPVMNKINAFLADPRIRQIFSSAKSSFNLREIIDNKKILLIKLDKGRLKGAADLLGSLLMAKIQMAAFSRSDVPPSRRTPFCLYIDEFQNFASESFMVVLSEARKYGLSLVMAHQTLAQIPEELRSLILGNAGLQVYFRINRRDAQLLAKEAFMYSGFEIKTFRSLHPVFWSLGEEWENKTEELQNLPPRCCYVKHKIEGGLIPLFTAEIEPPWEVLDMEEDEYLEYLKRLPFGEKYLVSRESLAVAVPRAVPAAREKVAELPSPLPRSIAEGTREPLRKAPVVPLRELTEELPSEPKGERQHRYLQNLIKRIAEEKGFRAVIEEPTSDGGRVDVGLEQEGLRIACEISVTSTVEQELANLEKCLRAGYDKVILCFPERKMLAKTEPLVLERFDQLDREKVLLLQPEELFTFLETEAAALAGTEEKVKGYKVKVQYQALEEEEKKARREAVAQVILQSLRRQKEGVK